MKLTYIYHSCYVVETDHFAIIFDYYKDSGQSLSSGYVHDVLLKRKERLYVVSSHAHPDHFNPEIMKWKKEKEKEDVVYLLSSDILLAGKAKAEEALFLAKGEEYKDENLYIRAFGSTDIGVSFLIKIEEKLLFHAGDLNNWHWIDESTPEEVEEAEKNYLEELGELSKTTVHLDVAMFPVDPRLGSQYMRGAEQFVSEIKTELLAPMHFGEAYDKVAAFEEYAERHGCCLFRLTQKGEQIDI